MNKFVRRAACIAPASLLLAVVPAGAVEKVLYEDAHARLVEVTLWPGDTVSVPAQKLPFIVASDSPAPSFVDVPGAKPVTAGAAGNVGMPPKGRAQPTCQVHAAQGAQGGAQRVGGEFPLHYYRMEFKRIDGDGYAANWQQWYPWTLKPVRDTPDLGTTPQAGAPVSQDFPYPLAYDAVTAAPANHSMRYSDAHVELIELFIRPGEREHMHGHPLPSVYFDDGGGFYPAIETTNEYLAKDAPPPRGEPGKPPAGSLYPTCYAAIPQWPHAVTVTGKAPQRFYRLQFRRLDGDDIRAQWRQWYPKR